MGNGSGVVKEFEDEVEEMSDDEYGGHLDGHFG